MNPQEAHDLIRAACLRRPDLMYRDSKRAKELNVSALPNFQGFCYIASQVFAKLTGAEVWASQDGMHYWNKLDEEIWDLTEDQFPYGYLSHNQGHKVPRKNELTARAKELYNELGI